MHSINIARLDRASLRLVVLCAEMGSLGAAARACGYSGPAGSQRLAALEAALDCRLFVRSPRGLEVTPAGQVAVEHGRAIQRQIELLQTELAD
jgi:DNA-binding transcriptional LysR family regulator